MLRTFAIPLVVISLGACVSRRCWSGHVGRPISRTGSILKLRTRWSPMPSTIGLTARSRSPRSYANKASWSPPAGSVCDGLKIGLYRIEHAHSIVDQAAPAP